MNQFEYSAAPPQATMIDRPLHTVPDEPVGETSDLAMISLVLGLCSGFYVGSVVAIIFGHMMKWGILASVLWLVVSFVVAVVVGVVVLRSKLRGVTHDEQVPNVTPRSNSPRSRIGIAAGAKDAQLSA
jgi:uncharacterized membrane protein